MICECCGLWEVEHVVLDGTPRLRLSNRSFLVGYFFTVDGLVQALAKGKGPSLDRFVKPAA